MKSTRNLIITIVIIAGLKINNSTGQIPATTGKSCNNFTECALTEDCFKNRCTYACKGVHCSKGMICATYENLPVCICNQQAGYELNSDGSCIFVPQCTVNDDCGKYMICKNNVCIRVCSIMDCNKPFEICLLSNNHSAECVCDEGYSRIVAESPCEPTPTDSPSCTDDNECTDSEMCRNNNCFNPCSVVNCHSTFEECVYYRNYGTKCECINGYARNRNTNLCKRVCRTDDQCSEDEICEEKNDAGFHVCGCKPGFTKIFYDRQCRKLCNAHYECTRSEMCSAGRCITATFV